MDIEGQYWTLGVDQGTNNVGWAIVNQDEEVISSGYINAKSKKTDYTKLQHIMYELENILSDFQPKHVVCEQIFSSPRTANGAMKTNLCTGLLYTLAIQRNTSLEQLVPATIKKQITGNGRAKKDEIIKAIKQHKNIKNDHEADAVAIAITSIRLKNQ